MRRVFTSLLVGLSAAVLLLLGAALWWLQIAATAGLFALLQRSKDGVEDMCHLAQKLARLARLQPAS